MKVNDIIKIKDFSWILSLQDGLLWEPYSLPRENLYKIVYKGECPTGHKYITASKPNNLMVVNTSDSSHIVFTHEELCKVITSYSLPIEIGDTVRIHDGSWNMAIVNGELKSILGLAMYGTANANRRYKVLSKGKFPTRKGPVVNSESPNNLMLVDIKDPSFIVFTQEEFCRKEE
jgi:hypothetical protein